MIAHPGIQKRAQYELDAVVGRARTPTFSDAPDLPYVQALVKESLRWRPALPLGIPHATTENTIGTKACSYPKGLFAWSISGNATMTRRLMAPMLQTSIRRGFWTSMVDSFRVL